MEMTQTSQVISMVPRAGFEPATLSLEVSCSIQLSYRGVVRDGVVETPSQVWKTCILTVIRIPPNRGDYIKEVLVAVDPSFWLGSTGSNLNYFYLRLLVA